MRIEKDQTVPEWNLGIKWAQGPEITVLLDSLPNMVGLVASYSAQPVRAAPALVALGQYASWRISLDGICKVLWLEYSNMAQPCFQKITVLSPLL
jgi:hypothetical protein